MNIGQPNITRYIAYNQITGNCNICANFNVGEYNKKIWFNFNIQEDLVAIKKAYKNPREVVCKTKFIKNERDVINNTVLQMLILLSYFIFMNTKFSMVIFLFPILLLFLGNQILKTCEDKKSIKRNLIIFSVNLISFFICLIFVILYSKGISVGFTLAVFQMIINILSGIGIAYSSFSGKFPNFKSPQSNKEW